MTTRTAFPVAAVLSLLVGATPSFAQTGQGQQQGAQELVFEREVFTYPAFDRRNPFEPLVGDEGGPRFENLTLLGILHSPVPGGSLVLLRGSGGEEGARTYRVREGDRLGNTTILDIQPERVVVEVEEFGVFEQHVLTLEKDESGEGAPS